MTTIKLPHPITHAVYLHSSSASNGGKDWIGAINTYINGGNLWIVNGKSKDVISGGGHGRYVKTKGTEQSLSDAVKKKISEGYYLVDEYRESTGYWDSQDYGLSKPTPQAETQPVRNLTPSTPIPFTSSLWTPKPEEVEEVEAVWCW